MYQPTAKQEELVTRVYNEFDEMRDVRDKRHAFFNDRTLKEFIDDSQLRLSGYVPSRASQGKERWQANVFHPVTRNKFKAILAAVALDVPQVRITAQNENSRKDQTRAYITKNLVNYSYNQDNKEENTFFEAWEAAEKGTVIVYDGYLRTRAKRKIIQSFDPITGEIETKDEEVEVENRCFNSIVDLMDLYIKDINIFDIQEQPSLVWVRRMPKAEFEYEFGKYKNAKFVPESIPKTQKEENDTFFVKRWSDRVTAEEPIEVIRYYNKINDEFIIIANGVVLLEAPLILGKKKKWYPFAKTVFEPFATNFFYGNSLPNNLMGEQDVINALWNMSLDKTYKSMTANLIIGNVNKDDFDLEDRNTTVDTKIYVEDINQVREMPISGVDQADVKMIDMVSRGLDLSSVDSNQQGVGGRGVTAREVVIANENAKKLKGILYMFLTSLWIQKINLRIMSILIYYTKPKVKMILGKDGESKSIIDDFRAFSIENAELSDGSKGTLGIQVYPDQESLPTRREVDIQEEEYKIQSGEKYELLAMVSDYLDDWVYDVKVISESIFQQDSSLSQMKMGEKLKAIGTFFPDLMMLNKEKLGKDLIVSFDDDPDEYEFQAPPMPQAMPGMPGMEGMPEGQMPGAEGATAGQTGLPPLPAL